MKELSLLHIALIYLVIINVATFFMYGIDKAASKRGQSQTRLSFAERKQARPKVKWYVKTMLISSFLLTRPLGQALSL